jgi:hypothetical protein
MANVHGLFSNKDDDDNDDDDDSNNRYVGGIGARGGGRYVHERFYSPSYYSSHWNMLIRLFKWLSGPSKSQ